MSLAADMVDRHPDEALGRSRCARSSGAAAQWKGSPLYAQAKAGAQGFQLPGRSARLTAETGVEGPHGDELALAEPADMDGSLPRPGCGRRHFEGGFLDGSPSQESMTAFPHRTLACGPACPGVRRRSHTARSGLLTASLYERRTTRWIRFPGAAPRT